MNVGLGWANGTRMRTAGEVTRSYLGYDREENPGKGPGASAAWSPAFSSLAARLLRISEPLRLVKSGLPVLLSDTLRHSVDAV